MEGALLSEMRRGASIVARSRGYCTSSVHARDTRSPTMTAS
jgi:hypothetical protein